MRKLMICFAMKNTARLNIEHSGAAVEQEQLGTELRESYYYFISDMGFKMKIPQMNAFQGVNLTFCALTMYAQCFQCFIGK